MRNLPSILIRRCMLIYLRYTSKKIIIVVVFLLAGCGSFQNDNILSNKLQRMLKLQGIFENLSKELDAEPIAFKIIGKIIRSSWTVQV